MDQIVCRLLSKRRAPLPTAGDRFSRLTFTGTFGCISERRANRSSGIGYRITCECRCDCGKLRMYRVKELVHGHVKSCGCLQRETASTLGKARRRLSDERRILRRTWKAMIARCRDPKNEAFDRYGARGITVSEPWRSSVEAFESWAMKNGFRPGLTLDRVDNDGPYSPRNCRWVSRLVQGRNRRNNIMIEAFGETKCLSEWLDDPRCRASRKALRYRIARGADPTIALLTPPDEVKSQNARC